MENRYRHTGNYLDEQKYHVEFKTTGVENKFQYSSESYPSLDWRILYVKELQDFQGAGAFTDYYDGDRIGTELTRRASNVAYYIGMANGAALVEDKE